MSMVALYQLSFWFAIPVNETKGEKKKKVSDELCTKHWDSFSFSAESSHL